MRYVSAGATLKSGPRGDCLLHIPSTCKMPSKSSPCAKLLYVQRPAADGGAAPGLYAAAAPQEPEQESIGSALEAQASVMVSGGTVSATDGDLSLLWLGHLGNFFAIGIHTLPCRSKLLLHFYLE